MDLKTYLNSLDKPAAEKLAKACETSVGHLRNCAYGSRTPSAELAVAIESYSKRAIRRQDLFPATFKKIWPELTAVKQKQAA